LCGGGGGGVGGGVGGGGGGGNLFHVDHAMICRDSGFIIQRHNELRDLEAEMPSMVCHDVVTTVVKWRSASQRSQQSSGRSSRKKFCIF